MGLGAGESMTQIVYVLSYSNSSSLSSSVCPGRDLADLSLFILLSTALAVFNISKPKDENGQTIEQVSEWTPGLISRPKGFRTVLTPRSEKAVTLVRAAEFDLAATAEKSDAETLLSISWDNAKSKLQ